MGVFKKIVIPVKKFKGVGGFPSGLLLLEGEGAFHSWVLTFTEDGFTIFQVMIDRVAIDRIRGLLFWITRMDEEEYNKKYINLRVLKSVQEYLKAPEGSDSAVYPIKVPDDLLYQTLKHEGAESADDLVHEIFKMGLALWSENLFNAIFGSQQSLEEFIEQVKSRTKK